MPHPALDLTIDRNAPGEKKGVMGVAGLARISGEKTKKAPDQEDDPRLRGNDGEYAEEFPEPVTPKGEDWPIRHVGPGVPCRTKEAYR